MNLNTITANISVHLTCSSEIRFDLILNNNLFTCSIFSIRPAWTTIKKFI